MTHVSPDPDAKTRETSPDPEAYLTKFEHEGYLRALHERYGSRFALYRQAWDLAARGQTPDFPLHLELEVTNHCNLSCPVCHCAQYTHDRRNKKFMSLDLLDRVLEQASGRLPAALVGACSECLLHPQIEDILLRLNRTGIMDLMIHTNGLLVTERLTRLLVELPLARINISVDAATPETYKVVRGGNLELLEKNILRVLEYRKAAGSALPYVRLTFVKQPANQHQLEHFLSKWQDKVDRIDIQELVELKGNDAATDLRDEDVRHTCAYPNRMLYVDYDGNAFPCCSFYYRFLKMGNIHDKTLEQIWLSDGMNTLRENFLKKKYYPVCRKCLDY
ncbi:MAG: molybdopterin cofactor synthesis protein [Desulfovibrionaceae bacterium]|nr:MAG: molybdopterin cofactor synthesis protein [Desulfovibrionaceae bacterium]